MARIRLRNLVGLCRRAGTALRAGLDARSVWQKEAGRGPQKQRTVIDRISRHIADGGTVAEAMRQSGGYFPPMTYELIDVGEQSGHLDAVLLQLADHYDHVLELRRRFLLGIMWPVVQLIGGILIVALLILILGLIGSETDVLGLGLSTLASLIVYFAAVLFVALAIALPVVAIARGWLGPAPIKLAMSIPVLGTALQYSALSRFAWSLGIALDAGMDVKKALHLSLASTQNPVYQRHADALDDSIRAGQSIHESLRATGEFPNEFLDILDTGELSGQLPETLARLSADYRDRAQALSKTLIFLASVLIWMIVAGLLIFVIIRLFLQLYLAPIQDALEPLQL